MKKSNKTKSELISIAVSHSDEKSNPIVIVNFWKAKYPEEKIIAGILAEFVEKYRKLADERNKKFFVVAAGSSNHGKSSLLNALSDNKGLFPVADIRTTVKQEEKLYKDNIYFVDTPGLNINDIDDNNALLACQKADLILYVHTLKDTVLRKNEAESINKIMEMFPKKHDFWERFVLVLTFKEAKKEDEYIEILDGVKQSLKNYCNCKNAQYKTLGVSNSFYWLGRNGNKTELISHSGINELRDYIEKEANVRKETFEKKLQALKRKTIKEIDKRIACLENEVNKKRGDCQGGGNNQHNINSNSEVHNIKEKKLKKLEMLIKSFNTQSIDLNTSNKCDILNLKRQLEELTPDVIAIARKHFQNDNTLLKLIPFCESEDLREQIDKGILAVELNTDEDNQLLDIQRVKEMINEI